jgi:hypothetical protein
MKCVVPLKHNGCLIFNDFNTYDPFLNVEYGVVRAASEMLASGEWRVVGFALEKHLFCDIALKRAPPPAPNCAAQEEPQCAAANREISA